MNKKQLLEKKNEIIEKMETILNSVEIEKRAINETEEFNYTSLEKELRELNAILAETEKQENLGGNTNMEKREFAQQLLQGEVRSDSTTHSNTIPTNIANEIIEKLYEVSNVVANAQMVQATGDLEFLVEKEDGFAQVLGETDEITPVDIKTFDKVILKEDDRDEAVALDPGERVFASYYSLNDYGYIGEDMRVFMLEILSKIKKLQHILSKNLNKDGNKIRNRGKIKMKIFKRFQKIKNKVKERTFTNGKCSFHLKLFIL